MVAIYEERPQSSDGRKAKKKERKKSQTFLPRAPVARAQREERGLRTAPATAEPSRDTGTHIRPLAPDRSQTR